MLSAMILVPLIAAGLLFLLPGDEETRANRARWVTLGVTLHTCRGYIKTLHNKLGVRTQLEAVIKAQALGIIGAPDDR